MIGQEATVDVGVGVLRDDVLLVAGLQHRHVCGVRQRPSHKTGGATEVAEKFIEVLVAPADTGHPGESVEEFTDRGDVFARPLGAAIRSIAPARWTMALSGFGTDP